MIELYDKEDLVCRINIPEKLPNRLDISDIPQNDAFWWVIVAMIFFGNGDMKVEWEDGYREKLLEKYPYLKDTFTTTNNEE